MKIRVEAESNYHGVWLESGRTLRFAIDPTKPITDLKYPEFYDIQITNYCQGGCKFCYQNSSSDKEHYKDVTSRLRRFFQSIPNTSLPFQIAYGGGEPTSHPEFNSLMEMTKGEFDISANFTTNGMWTKFFSAEEKQEHLRIVKTWCGGVAVSTHEHLNRYWIDAASRYLDRNIHLNLHVIISDKESIDRFLQLLDSWKADIKYFVLLPYTNVGRAFFQKKLVDWDYLVEHFPVADYTQVAFGARFHPYLVKSSLRIPISIYEPEIMSKYITVDNEGGTLYGSSFSDQPLEKGFLN